jgi:ubiquinone/menaquinone biosynthesis C-methylase UbiE
MQQRRTASSRKRIRFRETTGQAAAAVTSDATASLAVRLVGRSEPFSIAENQDSPSQSPDGHWMSVPTHTLHAHWRRPAVAGSLKVLHWTVRFRATTISPVEYDAEDVAAVFGRAAHVYDTVIPFFARFGARLVEFAALRLGESVLDVGAGRGATLIPAARGVGPSGRVVGVDLSDEMVALLDAEVERQCLTNASVLRMDAEALDVEADSFDVVLASFVLHLLPRPDAAAAGVRRALRAGGRVAASAPTAAGPHWNFLMRLYQAFAPRAVRPIPMPFRSDFDIAALLARAGLELVQSMEEQLEFAFVDEHEWWDWSWSAGLRAFFESLAPPDLAELREQALREVAALRTPDGVRLQQTARFVVARKPT